MRCKNQKNRSNFSKWGLVAVAILSLILTILTAIDGKVTVLMFICAELQVIICSLLAAFILHTEKN